MSDRPYTLLSCSVSIDGYIGSPASRLLLSNDADFDRVDAVRASCDAILVGANTVRLDNPRLLVRSQARRDERTARGLAPSPIKVTVTRRAELDAGAAFFTTGDTEKLVYCASPRVTDARARLEPRATVVDGGTTVEMRKLANDLAARGVERLMVEGGGKVHTQFLTDDLVDELQLVIAPMFVGDSQAPRFVRDGHFPWNPRSATWCCCATRSRRGSGTTDRSCRRAPRPSCGAAGTGSRRPRRRRARTRSSAAAPGRA
jgi:5-amino-6-(5-phosphoribosylamino)uracil reductase